MRTLKKRIISFSMVIALVVSLFSGFTPSVKASAAGTSASALAYNTGNRTTIATELSNQAKAYYSGNNVYSTLSQKDADEIYSTLHDLMQDTLTNQVTYTSLTNYWAKTDASNGKSGEIGFYSNVKGVSAINREHVWPKAHGYFQEKNAGADLHHLRPTNTTVNSTRNNYTMGNVRAESSNIKTVMYNDSTVAGWIGNNMFEPLDVTKGDVARIFLYVYCCWAQDNLFKAIKVDSSRFDSDDTKNDGVKVIESLDVLLEWCYEDPVDTWEMQRNDLAQQVQGNRNVFIDYPEYAWLLFGKEVPEDLVSPTSGNTELKQYPIGPDNSTLNEKYGGTGETLIVQLSAKRYSIPDGNYVIVSPSEGYALSSEVVSSYYRARVEFTGGTTTDSKIIWNITQNTDGSYTIQNDAGILGCEPGHHSLPLNGTANKWYLYGDGNGRFFFMAEGLTNDNPLYLNSNSVNNEFSANEYTGAESFKLIFIDPVTGAEAQGQIDNTSVDPVITPVPTAAPVLPETPAELKDGNYVIVNAASLKALSVVPASNNFYLSGKNVTFTNKVLDGTPTDDIIWALTNNADGTVTLKNSENALSMGESYTSTPLCDVNDTWKIERSNNGTVLIYNVGRDGYALEWFASKDYFSGYNNISDLSAFEMILIPLEGGMPIVPTTTPEPTVTPVPGTLSDGKYVIYNANSGMAMSVNGVLTSSGSTNDFYRAGVAYTVSDGKIDGEVADTEIWVLTNNADGTVTLSNGTNKLSMNANNASAPLNETNDTWVLEANANGTYYVINKGRDGYALEWFAKNNEFSAYNKISGSEKDYEMTFIALETVAPTPTVEPTITPVPTTSPEPTQRPIPSVTPAVPQNGYVKIGSLDELSDGQYVIVALSKGNYFAMDAVGSGDKNFRPAIAITVADNQITSSVNDNCICTITKTSDGKYTIQDKDRNFLPMSKVDNKCFGQKNLSTADKYCFYDVEENGAEEGALFFTNENNKKGNNLRAIVYNADSKDFRGLDKTTKGINPLFLFKISSQSLVNFYVDGVLYNSQAVDNGKDAVAPVNPENYSVRDDAAHKTTYYTFEKWDVDFTGVTEDIDVKAVFTKTEVFDPKYTVSFFEDENAAAANVQEVYSLDDVVFPADPVKEDVVDEEAKTITKFSFVKWNKIVDETNEYIVNYIAEYNKTVEDIVEPIEFTKGQFVKINSLAELEDGLYLLVSHVKKTNDPYAMNNIGTTTRDGVAVTINNNIIVTDNKAIVWNLKKQADGTYTIADLDGKFLPMSNNGNKCYGGQTATLNNYCFYTAEENGTEGAIFFTNYSGYGRLISIYDNSGKNFVDYRGYKSTVTDNIRPLYLYKYVGEPVETVTVTFLINGDEYKTTIEKGSNVTAPFVTPVKADEYDPATHMTTKYTFTGWNKSLENITEDTVIEPVFSSEQIEDTYYMVVFMNGRTQIGEAQKVYEGEAAVAPTEIPKKADVYDADAHMTTKYTFTGWDTDFSAVYDNLTIRAEFESTDVEDDFFLVVFRNEGTIIGQAQKVYKGEAAVAPTETPVKANKYNDHITTVYTFKGWDKDFTDVQSNLDVNAEFTSETFEDPKTTVEFVVDGQEVSVQEVYADETPVAPETPVKADERDGHFTTKYSFDKWEVSVNDNREVIYTAVFTSIVVEDEKFTVEYQVTDNGAAGFTVPATESYYAGDKVELAAALTANGFEFSGWSKETTDGKFEMPAENVVITGFFTEIIDTPVIPTDDPLPKTGDNKRGFVIVCLVALLSLAGFKFAEKKENA